MNVDRAICGLATCFDTGSADGDRWSAEHFDRWLADRWMDPGDDGTLPMRVDHGDSYQPAQAMLTLDGKVAMFAGQHLTSIGRWTHFAVVREGSTAAGLLVLGEVAAGPVADGHLAAVRVGWLPGLSVGAKVRRDDSGVITRVWLTEVSLVVEPAFDDALVVGTGQSALSAWELLTGQSVEVSA